MLPVRLATRGAISGLMWWKIGFAWWLSFVLVEATLYAILWRLIQITRSDPGQRVINRTMGVGVVFVTASLGLHLSLVTMYLWRVYPIYQPHLLIMMSAVLIVGAFQFHVNRRCFALSVITPSATIAWCTFPQTVGDPMLQISLTMFIIGVAGAAWRHWRNEHHTIDLVIAGVERSRQLQDALAQAESDRVAADRANQAKSRFLAMISHEVRTPLNVIMGMIEVLRARLRSKAEAAVVTDMADAGGMLLRLLNGALDLSKIESGQVTLQVAPIDLGEKLESLARVWRSRVEELGLTLEVERHGAPEHFVVLTDEARVEQVLINYLSNALKLTPKGVIRLVAHALPTPDGRVDLNFEVHDQGPGVPEDQRERIFQPFEQLAAGRAAGGSGLGLALCRATVEGLGGALGVRSALPQGAVFWFRFSADLAGQCPVSATKSDAVSTCPQDRAPRILAAEDHPANRKVLTLLLEPFGVDLTLVEDGRQAVEAMRTQAFDIVLMDVMMPVMDGVEAVAVIRAEQAAAGRAHTPIHMLTANVFDEDVARYVAAGADGVLRKPIEIRALQSVIMDAAAIAA